VRQGVFREDLFHRLNVIRLRLPALRERREDIPMLTRFFLARAHGTGRGRQAHHRRRLQRLQAFDFPGNVRQLENICHWLTVMAPAQVVEPKDLPPELMQPGDAGAPAGGGAAPHAVGACARSAARCRRRRPGLPVARARGPPPAVPCGGPAHLAGRPGARGAPPAGRRRARGVGRADAPVRGPADPHRAGDHAWAPHRSAHSAWASAADPHRHHARPPHLGIGRNTITRKIQELGLDD
jgi:two-component system nitrogen regulation response regulator GlnG